MESDLGRSAISLQCRHELTPYATYICMPRQAELGNDNFATKGTVGSTDAPAHE